MTATPTKTDFIEIRTSDLLLKQLDWAVATHEMSFTLTIGDDGKLYMPPCKAWAPSQDWGQGGPLLAIHNITWDGQAATICKQRDGRYQKWTEYGQTQLVAGLRAILAWRNGPTMLVPAELAH